MLVPLFISNSITSSSSSKFSKTMLEQFVCTQLYFFKEQTLNLLLYFWTYVKVRIKIVNERSEL